MKMLFLHLTGSLRGRTQYFDTDAVSFGIGEGCGIVFDASLDTTVCPIHAELVVEDHTPIIRDRSGREALLVNGHRTAEADLRDGDLIQFGEGGPLVRFRLGLDGVPATKPWRDIVTDSRDIVVRTPHPRYMSPVYLARHVLADVLRYGSPVLKVAAVLLVLIPILVIAGLGVLAYRQHRAVGAAEQRLAEAIGQLEAGRLSRASLEQRIDEQRRAAAELQRERDALLAKLTASLKEGETARRSVKEIQAIRREIDALEGAQRFAEEVVQRYERGVGLLQGGYAFREQASGRLLRYKGFDVHGDPLLDEKGNTLVTVEGTAPPVVVYYGGTGFLADERGTVLTNRHLVRMWEDYEPAQEALRSGFEPDLRVLRIFFPGAVEPYDLEVLAISDRVDLAVLRAIPTPKGMPALRLAPADVALQVGEPLVVLSYPGTFDSLIGRLAKPVGDDLVREAGADPLRLAETLSKRRLIRPLATQGHLSGLSADVVAFEAGSAGGSSGGPVFDRGGRVVAVNQAVLRRVGAVNLGLPVREAWSLLAKAGVTPPR